MANTPEPKAFSDLPVPRVRGSGVQTVYDALKQSIVELTLEPGAPLDEVTLAERFDMSRTPVREALVRLAADGLVQTFPNKGTIVSPLNIEEFPAYIDALDLVQRAVFRLAATHRTDADLAAIRAANEEFRARVRANDALGMIAQNAVLHLAMSAAGRNRILTDTYRRILDEGRRTLRLYYRSYGDTLPESLCDAHDTQIEAIAARDAALAERLAHEHAVEVHQRFLHYLSQRNTSDFTVEFAG